MIKLEKKKVKDMKKRIANKEIRGGECHCGHHKIKGLWMLIIGLIFIGNSYMLWTTNWWLLIGFILAIFGLVKLLMPSSH